MDDPVLYAVLERIGEGIKTFPPGFTYNHIDETSANPWKIFYMYADSLFGYDWLAWKDEGDIQKHFPYEAISTLHRGDVVHLCEEIFVDDGELFDKIGKDAKCWWNLEESCDQKDINRGAGACADKPWLRTVINVEIYDNKANPYPGMEVTLQNFWNAMITPEDDYAPYAPQTVRVRGIHDDYNFVQFKDGKGDLPGVSQENLIFNYYNFLDVNKANCMTGLKIDLRDTYNLCGKTDLSLQIVGITELTSTTNIQMTELQTHVNNNLKMWTTYAYDGHDKYIEIEGGCLSPFLGTRVEFELIATNCAGDREAYRNFVEVTTDDIRMYDSNGELVSMSGTICTIPCPMQ